MKLSKLYEIFDDPRFRQQRDRNDAPVAKEKVGLFMLDDEKTGRDPSEEGLSVTTIPFFIAPVPSTLKNGEHRITHSGRHSMVSDAYVGNSLSEAYAMFKKGFDLGREYFFTGNRNKRYVVKSRQIDHSEIPELIEWVQGLSADDFVFVSEEG